MTYIQRVHLYTDGGCKGNPGAGAIGIVICTNENKPIHEYSDCIGNCTNNQAEYKALIKGLDLCAKYTRREVVCFSDSELVIKQMNGNYRLRDDALRELWHKVYKNRNPFSNVTFQHVNKTNQTIQRADTLVKQAHEGKCIDKSYEIF